MTSHKYETYSSSEKKARQETTERARKARAEVIAAGGSCLTCHHTKKQQGVFLVCSLKEDKRVSQYNFCDLWKPMTKKTDCSDCEGK